jgi:hypothetical protein
MFAVVVSLLKTVQDRFRLRSVSESRESVVFLFAENGRDVKRANALLVGRYVEQAVQFVQNLFRLCFGK